MNFDRRHIFLAITVTLLACVIAKMLPRRVAPYIKATLIQQKGQITSIDTPRQIDSSKTLVINNMEFDSSTALVHRYLGPLGLSHDFFIDFEATFEVTEADMYVFSIESDDGFRLFIDETKISEFLGDRPMASSDGQIELAVGTHKLKMSYFQGYGNLGLVGKYRREDSKRSYVIGESSRYIKFQKIG